MADRCTGRWLPVTISPCSASEPPSVGRSGRPTQRLQVKTLLSVLAHSTWQSRFGGAADIVGTRIALRGVQLEVVGVAAQGFNGLGETPLDFWVPVTLANQLEMGPDLFGPEQPRGLRILGRLQSHLSIGQAEARLGTWVERLTARRPEANGGARATLHSRATAVPLTPQVIAAFSPVATVFALVLGVACANVANMMLARGLDVSANSGSGWPLEPRQAGLYDSC